MGKVVLGAVAAVMLAVTGVVTSSFASQKPDIEKFYASVEKLNNCEGWKLFLKLFRDTDSPWVKLARLKKKQACYVPPWEKTFGGRQDDVALAITALPDGDVVVAGFTKSKGAGMMDMWILRLDERGNVVWEKTFGGSYSDGAAAVAALPGGDVVVAGGKSTAPGPDKQDVWVLRLDERGNVMWDKTFGGSQIDVALAITALSNGDVVVAGFTKSKGAGKVDMWILRLDERGNLVWDKTFGESDANLAVAVAALPGGDVVVVGWKSVGLDPNKSNMWILRLNAYGNVIWDKTFDSGINFWSKKMPLVRSIDITALPDGDVVVASFTESKGAGKKDMWILRLNAHGNVVWEKTFGGTKNDTASAVAALPDGDIVVAGNTESKGAGKADMWILRLDEYGRAP